MADRRPPIRKSPAEILDDLLNGHREAMITGVETARKYLIDRGLTLCNAAIALGLGPSYQAKRASIERMI